MTFIDGLTLVGPEELTESFEKIIITINYCFFGLEVEGLSGAVVEAEEVEVSLEAGVEAEAQL